METRLQLQYTLKIHLQLPYTTFYVQHTKACKKHSLSANQEKFTFTSNPMFTSSFIHLLVEIYPPVNMTHFDLLIKCCVYMLSSAINCYESTVRTWNKSNTYHHWAVSLNIACSTNSGVMSTQVITVPVIYTVSKMEKTQATYPTIATFHQPLTNTIIEVWYQYFTKVCKRMYDGVCMS